jgi:hypothetical protein
MFQRVLISTISLLACSALVAYADPKDDIQTAVQKLVDSPNYSWTTTVEGGFGRGPTDGKTQKDGLTWISMQMRDASYEIIMQGDKIAIKTPDGWKSGAEATTAPSDDAGGPPPPERMIAMMAQNFKTPSAQAKDQEDKLQNIQKTDDGYSADLSPEAAKAMLTFRPRRAGADAPQIEVSNAKASMKLSIKDGALTKVEIHVTGTVSFNGNDRDVDRTTTTEIKDVGSTTIDVPDDAKAKLSS